MDLKDKVMVVTGAGNGLGRQLTLLLLERQARVAAVDIREDSLKETLGLAGSSAPRLSLHRADVANGQDIARVTAEVLGRYGYVDGLINNARIIHAFKPITDLDVDVLRRMIDVNLYGTVNFTKSFLPSLLGRPAARIINVSSMGGLFAFPGQAFYGASKAAVKLFTEGLYAELKGTSVGVTLVVPGAINTGITKNCNAHNEKFDRASKYFSGTEPRAAARRIVEAIKRDRFKVNIGADATVLATLYRLSQRLTILLMRQAMNLVLRV